MEMEKIINKLEEEIGELFHGDGSGHDMHHLKRVLNVALSIQEKEGGDKLIIAISAFLHDIHRIIEKETGKFCHPRDSLLEIEKILNLIDLTKQQKEKILHCIEFHEEYSFSQNGKTVNDIETLILQDADNLDSMGALGIGRTFTFGGSKNIPMWIPEKSFSRDIFDESENDISSIHHFRSKLLRLGDNMNTKTAQNMSRKRHEFMELFFQEFFDEWSGKK